MLLTTAFGFFKSHFKVIGYVIIAFMIASAGWKLYSIVEISGQYKAIIATQEAALKVKENRIQALEQVVKITNEIIVDRDKQVEDLEKKIDGITTGLGGDADDQAADSLKEYFRRLNNL